MNRIPHLLFLLLLLAPSLRAAETVSSSARAKPPPGYLLSKTRPLDNGQIQPPILVPNGKKVFIYFPSSAREYLGVQIYRAPGKMDLSGSNILKIYTPPFQELTSPIYSPSKTSEDLKRFGAERLPEEYRTLSAGQLVGYWKDYLGTGMRAPMVVTYFDVMARIGGQLWVDEKVVPGKTYTYLIALVARDGGLDYFPPEAIQVKPTVVPAATGLRPYEEEKTAGVFFSVPKNKTLLGVHVYRSEKPEGPFVKQTPTLFLGNDYSQSGLKNGKPYFYQVQLVDLAGNVSQRTKPVKAIPRDKTPPFPPTDLKISVNGKKALLTWVKGLDKDKDLKGFRVLREEVNWKQQSLSPSTAVPVAPPPKPIPALTKNLLPPKAIAFADTQFLLGKRYFYYVEAVDFAGNKSLRAGPVTFSTPDPIPPAPPRLLRLKKKNREGIFLGWDKNKEQDLFGYRVFKSKDNKTFAMTGPNIVKAPQFVDTQFYSNETYFYKIIALDESENKSRASNILKVKTPDTLSPSAPAAFFAKAGDSRVFLQWTPVKDADLKSYRVLNALSETGPFVPIGKDFGKKASTYLHKPLKNGQKRWYVVQAVDYSGNVSEPTDPVLALPADAVPPAAPASLAFSASEGVVLLTVKPNKEKDIAGYKLFRVAEIPTGVPEEVFPGQLFPPTQKEIRVEYQTPETPHWYFLVARDTSENESRDGVKAGPVIIKSKTPP